jgi:hypothetical protein
MSKSTPTLSASADAVRAELTIRGLILGVAITLIFTAAMSISAGAGRPSPRSRPRDSMAVLRGFGA